MLEYQRSQKKGKQLQAQLAVVEQLVLAELRVVLAERELDTVAEPAVLEPALVAQVFAGFEYRSARKMQHRV